MQHEGTFVQEIFLGTDKSFESSAHLGENAMCFWTPGILPQLIVIGKTSDYVWSVSRALIWLEY